MSSFICYIHFNLSGQWMDCGCRVWLVVYFIRPLPLGKVRQSNIALILGHLYFLLFLKM